MRQIALVPSLSLSYDAQPGNLGGGMMKIFLFMAMALLSFQAVASDETGLRNRRQPANLQSDQVRHLIMTDDIEDEDQRKKRLERLACQLRPLCFADLRHQLVGAGWVPHVDARYLSPVQALAVNHGEVVVYFPDALGEAKRQKQAECEERLRLYFNDKRNKFPPLDPEGMADFPGNPDYLKLPKDYWHGLQIKYFDKRTACVLRRCSKSLYTQLREHHATADYFLKRYEPPRGESRMVSFYQHPKFYWGWQEEHLWDVASRLRALEWFKTQHPNMDITFLFGRLADYEWCPRLLFDRGYWRMKRANDAYLEHSESWKKLILATHGGDNLGSILYFGLKCAINISLLGAYIYLSEGQRLVVPDSCTQIYWFSRGAFVPSIDARDTIFSWVRPYRTMTVTIPFLAFLMKDMYMLATHFNAPLKDKDRVLDLPSRWPLWSRDSLPKAWQKDELGLVTFAFAYCIFFHPQFIMWAVPLTGPVRESSITVGDFTQLLTTNAVNASWMKGCCMAVANFVQPGCYVPWALDAAKEVTTYSITEFAHQGIARLVNAAPLIMVGITWMFYYMVVRGVFRII